MNKHILYLLVFLSLPLYAAPWNKISEAEIKQRFAELTPLAWDGKVKESKSYEAFGCLVSELTLKVRSAEGKNWNFSFTLVTPNAEKKHPLVMVLPTIERITPLEPTIAYQLCKADYAVAVIDANDNSQPSDLPGWGHEDKVLRHTILTIRTIMDWAQSDARVYKTKLALFGHSLGGITASLMASVEAQRLKAVIVAVGAGNMPGILTNSIYPRVALLRWRRFAALKDISSDDYEAQLRKVVKYDPLFFASRVKPERLYFVMAAWDRSVPYEYQLQTYKAFGSPEYHLFSPGTHIDGLIRLATIDFDKIKDFLDFKLK
ncbi:MAG: alpha/beta hydrolase [Bacteriovoracaceae bacterium]|nr:alpha/beta hydrolase [Bacteriovoracaceae bacterium]